MSQDSSSKKAIVHIIYPCFVCGGEYGTAGGVIQHIKNVHGYILIPRPTGHHRPADRHYEFETDVRRKWDAQHYGCASCWFHAPKNPETILKHVMDIHEPQQVEGFIQRNEDEEDELYEEQSDQEDDQEDESKGKNNDKDDHDGDSEENDEDKLVGVFSSLLQDEKAFVNEVYNMLLETTNMFKKPSGRDNTSN